MQHGHHGGRTDADRRIGDKLVRHFDLQSPPGLLVPGDHLEPGVQHLQRELLHKLANQEDQHNSHGEFGQTQNQHVGGERGDVLDHGPRVQGLRLELEEAVDPEPYGHPGPGSQDGGGVRSGRAVVIRRGVIVTQEEGHHYDAHREEGAG